MIALDRSPTKEQIDDFYEMLQWFIGKSRQGSDSEKELAIVVIGWIYDTCAKLLEGVTDG